MIRRESLPVRGLPAVRTEGPCAFIASNAGGKPRGARTLL